MRNDVSTATSSTRLKVMATLVALVLLAAAVIWVWLRVMPVSPKAVEGWAQPNADGTAIGLLDSPDAENGESYVIAGADWRHVGGPWTDGTSSPTCVGTDPGVMTRVRLGLVMVKVPEGSTRQQVIWLECLD